MLLSVFAACCLMLAFGAQPCWWLHGVFKFVSAGAGLFFVGAILALHQTRRRRSTRSNRGPGDEPPKLGPDQPTQ